MRSRDTSRLRDRLPGARYVNIPGLLTVAAALGLWQLLNDTGLMRIKYLPPPSQIYAAGERLLSTGELVTSAGHTVLVSLVSWLAAGIIGVGFGVLFGLSDSIWRYGMATIEVLRSIPSIALVPIAVLIFGFSGRMEVVLTVYVAQWPILVNTIQGVRRVEPTMLDSATTLHLSTHARLQKVIIPAGIPFIAVGLRLGLALSLVLTVVAEMIGNPQGLGYQLVFQQQAGRAANMFAYILVVGILGIVMNAVFVALSRIVPGSYEHARARWQ